MERDEFDSCREVIDFLVEKLNLIPIDNIPVFASRGNVEDWDEPFLLINSPDVRIDECVKRCYITIDIRCGDGSDYEAVVDKIEDIVQVLDSDPNLTSFSSDSGQLFISYILSEIDPDECKHES
ncbi:hypothetical protein AKJ53_01105 [candidate division MSBL1 archaeon SCGC-AAA382F02]|uniref:Uncharacterized protein n=1 Tax=candidate division MSBL1 archaeon SCGC-AAA382F02 TaxID=1698282 RepID=A0A133VI86_9EURY|nr:hypothetical protein AKJ53_01105 [candidate division MSBL1 archaeon SCGC-AAA382F02]